MLLHLFRIFIRKKLVELLQAKRMSASRPFKGIALASFPPEILESITSALSSYSICLLYFCGDSALNTKLCNGGVRKFVHRPDLFGSSLWPSLLRRLTSLTYFKLAAASSPLEFPIEPPTKCYGTDALEMLPSTLLHLHVSGDFRFANEDVGSLFPNLRSLELSGALNFPHIPLKWPTYLGKLILSGKSIFVSPEQLPETLTHLEDHFCSIEFVDSYPRRLRTLSLGTKLKTRNFESTSQKTLTSNVLKLPPNLKYLTLGPRYISAFGGRRDDDEEKLARLPESLRYLTLYGPSTWIQIGLLPRNLLSLRVFPEERTAMEEQIEALEIDHIDWKFSDSCRKLGILDLLALPPSLTELVMDHWLTSASSDSSPALLPPSLTTYGGLKSELTSNDTLLLPSTLTALQCKLHRDESALSRCKNLLKIDCATNDLINLKIPENVTFLRAFSDVAHFEPIVLPPSITAMDVKGRIWFDPKQKQDSVAPPNLKVLKVSCSEGSENSNVPLVNSFKTFSYNSLTTLLIEGGIFANFLFKEMPRSLTAFSFSDGWHFGRRPVIGSTGADLSPKCFTLLPPNLRHFQLRLSQPFDVSQISIGTPQSLRTMVILSRNPSPPVDLKLVRKILPNLSLLAFRCPQMLDNEHELELANSLNLTLHIYPS